MANDRNILNNTPRVVLNGIDDRSVPTIATTPQVFPIHLPLFYLQTQKGPDNDVVIVNNYNEAVSIFGEDTFNVKSDYFNHATALALRLLNLNNPIYIRRVIRNNLTDIAKEANGILAVEVDTTTDFLPYVRLSDGTIALDSNNLRITVTKDTGSTDASPLWKYNNIAAVQVDDAAGTVVGAPGWIPTSTIDLYPFPITKVLTVTGALPEAASLSLTGVGAVKAGDGVINTADNKVWRITTTVTTDAQLALAGSFQEWVGFGAANPTSLPVATQGFIYGSTDGITLRYRWLGYADYQAAIEANTFTVNTTGTVQTLTVDTKTYYPLFYFESNFKGVYGNSYGVKLWTANRASISPGDLDVITDQEAMMYNAQLVYKVTPTATASIVRDTIGEAVVSFIPKKNAFNFKTNQLLDIKQLVSNYIDDGVSSGNVPIYGPLGKIVHYTANINHVLDVCYTKEQAYNPNSALITSKYLLDLFSAADFDSIPFIGFKVASNGAQINQSRSYLLSGGNDGDLTDATFETTVIDEIANNTENPNYPLLDMARFPFSCVYDSGFSMDVKNAILTWPSKRKNVHVAIGTHTVGNAALSIAEEKSVGLSLATTARMYSESDYWNTPATRSVLMAQSGILINDPYQERVSTVFQLAEFRAKCLGSQTGAINSEELYESAPKSVVTSLKKLSSHYLNEAARDKLWTTGLNYAISFDTRSFFFPSLQTVYGIGQSILSSEMIMQICADLELKADRVWRYMVNSYSLSDAQFIAKSNKLFNELTNGIYGSIVRVVPNTYFTPMDSVRGYSWVMDITVYGNVPKTVGEVNIIAKRDIPAA